MKISLMDDGNLALWVRLALVAVGVAIVVAGVECEIPNLWARILVILGFFIALIGGVTSRAKLLHIKPFDNSYKKARKSYETKDREGDS